MKIFITNTRSQWNYHAVTLLKILHKPLLRFPRVAQQVVTSFDTEPELTKQQRLICLQRYYQLRLLKAKVSYFNQKNVVLKVKLQRFSENFLPPSNQGMSSVKTRHSWYDFLRVSESVYVGREPK